SAACGAISPSANSRTTRRSASCSSVNSTCTASLSRRPGPGAPPRDRTLPGVPAPIDPEQPLAVVGGRLATELVDVTSDLAALDSEGFWAVVLPFEGDPVCARFARVRPARPWPGPAWVGPARDAWTSSLDR